MTQKLATYGVLAGLVLALAAATFWWLAARQVGEGTTADETPRLAGPDPGETMLFFPGRGDRLYRETRELAASPDIEEHVRAVLAELLTGPLTDGLYPALPEGIEIGDVVVTQDGTVYIDLASKEALLSGLGSKAELLTVYSLVNTTLLNEPRARVVVLLWNGRQPVTLAGHVDVAHPLGVNRTLIAENS